MTLSLLQTVRLPLVIACAIVCLTVWGRSPVGAAAPVFRDNFDDNRMNGALWISDRDGNGPVIQEVNGRVEVTFPANSSGSEFNAQFVSRFSLRGNYDISVDYELLDWPDKNGVRFGIGGLANVHRVSLGDGEFPGDIRNAYTLISLATPSYIRAPATGVSGRLRIVRSGSTATGYYLDPGLGNWVAFGSLPVDSREAYISLTAWSHDYAFADQPVKVAFDNFVLNAGELLLPVDLAGLELSSPSVVGSTSLTGTVYLTGPAPTGGLVVDLGSTGPAVSVPATVVVPAGATSQSFPVSTSAVGANTQVAVEAAFAGASVTRSLLVKPVAVQSLTLSPAVVVGGGPTVTGTLKLNVGAAPASYTVTLGSSSPAVAAPATGTVLVPAGSSQATFQVETQLVSVRTPVVITATLNGVQNAAQLNVDPVYVGAIVLTSPNGGETWAPSSSHAITWESTDVAGPVKLEYSADDGATWSTITDLTPNDGSHPWTVPAGSTTQARVRVSEVGQPEVMDTSDASFTIAAMALTVTSPNGGEVWAPLSPHTITWSSLNVVDPVRLEYSTNNGSSWSLITASTENDGSLAWVVPNLLTSQARVRIFSVNNVALGDTSNGAFTIGVPSLTMIDPNGGEIWTGGTTETLNWTSANLSGSVKLEYSTDNGATWSSITAGTANDGSEPWTVPNTVTTQARVRISSLATPSVSDTSDQPFRISVPTVTLTSPGGGESWSAGSTHSITWTSSDVTGSVKLEYSTNNGATWSSIAASTANDGSHEWTMPAIATAEGRVRITALAQPSATDTSDAAFSISLGTLALLAPNGGETWTSGSTHAITWSTTGLIYAVQLEYTVDGGANWTTIKASTPNDGSETWTVPSVLTSQARVRVSAVNSPGEADSSDSVFTISAAPALHLLSPNGGEVWDTRSTHSITWSSESVPGSVKLEYSPDGGTTWTTLVASTPNDGLHSWTLPDAPTSQGRIRVSQVDGTATDTSDTAFTIRYLGGTLQAPTRVNFGAIKLGKSKTVAVTLSNTHRTEGLMVSLAVTGATFLLSSQSGPVTIPPRKKLKVLLRCAPAARGATTGQLLLSSSDRARPARAVSLTGSGK